MKQETKCLHSGYVPKNGEPRQMPIYQSTTFKYDSSDAMGRLFDLEDSGYFYTRLQNPSNDMTAAKIADLEGGVAAMLTSSGQAANFFALFNICETGSHIVASSAIYGGTYNLLGVTMKKMGIDVTFVDQNLPEEELAKAFKPNTRAMFGETITNPTVSVLDIEKFARLAHSHGVPLIVDNTFATPVNCQPIKWGADIVTHSTTKYMDGHAVIVGGCIVDGGRFDWAASGKFPLLCTPDESYHGVVYTRDFGAAAYVTKARVQLVRDFGVYPSAQDAFLLDLGLQTLAVRLQKHCANAQRVAEYILDSGYAEYVNYPGLACSPDRALAEKYLPDGCGGVVSFCIRGGKEAALRFMNELTLFTNAVHVATVQSCLLHPATTTHRQLSDEMLAASGVDAGLIRMSVGIEDIDDIISDIAGAFAAAEIERA